MTTRVLVLFGGQSAEHDVSCVTAKHVLDAMPADRYSATPIGITRDGEWSIVDPTPGADALDPVGDPIDPFRILSDAAATGDSVVLPLLHGPMGEDGTVQGLCELVGVPYAGAGVLGSALAMDKLAAKRALASAGLPQAPWLGLHVDELGPSTAATVLDRLGPTVFVKPANMGSSVGVGKASSEDDLRAALDDAARYDEWLVVEEAIVGREIEISVLGNRHPRTSLPGEIVAGAEFYTYEDKYHDGLAKLLIPAPLSDGEIVEMSELAIAAFQSLRVEGLARADFFYEPEGRGWLVNELNTMPGFTPISMYPKMWAASGLAYPDLIDEIIQLGLERHARRRRTTER